jgi:Ca2+-binding RTX toxin-like protein
MSNLRKSRRPFLSVEPLEARDVPATATLYGASLVIDGTDRGESITVRQDGTRITVDGTSVRDGWRRVSFVETDRVRQVVIHARGGDDTVNLSTLKVDAMVWGGAGSDRVYGGYGSETVYGDPGNDTILAGAGDDWLVGGDGNDQIWGGYGNDWVTGDNGNDRVYGDAGNDSLSGGEGQDLLSGGSGADEFDGHGFGMGRMDAARNFDTYQDEFDLWRPFPAVEDPAVLEKGELDSPGYLAALGSLSLADMKAAIRVIARGEYDVTLPGDRRTIRVKFDGTWTDTDPMPRPESTPAFAVLLLNRARLISFGIDPVRYYSNEDWDAQNARTRGKLYDPADALRQLTGRAVSTTSPSSATFSTLKDRIDRGAGAVAYSYRAGTRTANATGVMGDMAYVVRRLFTDNRGKQWVELGNPLGTDSPTGQLLDNAPGAVRQNDGVITLTWDDFRRSSNFTALYVA